MVAAVAYGVAYLVVRYGLSVVAYQLVLPLAVVFIDECGCGRAESTRGVGVFFTLKNVACIVVGVGCGLVREAVVYPCELIKRIICVGCALSALGYGGHVAVVVVGIGICRVAAVLVALQHGGL